MRPLAVLLAGGGTAGHISPLLALADCLRRRDPATGVLALGTATGMEARLVPARGYELATMARVPLPRRPGGDLLRLPARLAGAVREAERAVVAAGEAVGAERADVVVGLGGYVSAPAYLAARRLGVPLVVHEANSRPGVANRLGARLTRHVAVTFPGTPLPHAVLTGLPLRQEITAMERTSLRSAARAHFGLDPDATTLLVTGGSLGAARINAAFAGGIDRLLDGSDGQGGSGRGPLQVLHLTGAGKSSEILAALTTVAGRSGPTPGGPTSGGPTSGGPTSGGPTSGGPTSGGPSNYRVLEYTDRMDLAFAAADLALCRAGAATVCELAAVGLPAVFVPLPIGNGEQRHNAAGLVAAGGAMIVDDADLTPGWVALRLRDLLLDRPRLAAMSSAASATGIRDGDERLADLVELAAGRSPLVSRPV